MSDTTSIDAAAAAVLALLAQLELSNARLVQGQDTGTADAYVVAPTPSVSSYGADLALLVDIANPNATTTPKINVSGLGWLTITTAEGNAMPVGGVNGKCLFGLSSAAGGGYTAKLMSTNAALLAALVAAAVAGNVASAMPGQRSGLVSFNDGSSPLTKRNITATSFVVSNGAGVNATVQGVAVSISTNVIGPGGLDVGVLQPNTPYFEYVITKPGAASPVGICSLSSTGPSFANAPGYSMSGRVGGALVTDSNKNLRVVLQRNNRCQYIVGKTTNTPALPLYGSGALGTWDLTNPTWAALSTAALVPSTATEIIVAVTNSYTGGSDTQGAVAPNNQYGSHWATAYAPIVVGSAGGQDDGKVGSFLVEGAYIYAASNGTDFAVSALGWTEGS